MTKDKKFNHPIIVISILQRENNYAMFKELMLKYRMPS